MIRKGWDLLDNQVPSFFIFNFGAGMLHLTRPALASVQGGEAPPGWNSAFPWAALPWYNAAPFGQHTLTSPHSARLSLRLRLGWLGLLLRLGRFLPLFLRLQAVFHVQFLLVLRAGAGIVQLLVGFDGFFHFQGV